MIEYQVQQRYSLMYTVHETLILKEACDNDLGVTELETLTRS